MKYITKDMMNALQEVAERLIGSCILALEHDDISEPDSWIFWPDHWESDMSDGRKILTMLGLSDVEIDEIENKVREELEEEDDDDD